MDELLAFLQSGKVQLAHPDYLKQLAEGQNLSFKVLRAITIVESGGHHAYDARNRPVLLYEPHIYYKLIPARKRDTAVAKNLARKIWDKRFYNLFQKTPDDRWELLERAAEFHDAEAAVGCCSWGPAQIVASKWAKPCGYKSASDFVRASMNEEKMLDAFIAVLIAMKLRDAINDGDFETVALQYNGKGQVPVYAARMRKAFNRL
jgi:N-acetylmuramidase